MTCSRGALLHTSIAKHLGLSGFCRVGTGDNRPPAQSQCPLLPPALLCSESVSVQSPTGVFTWSASCSISSWPESFFYHPAYQLFNSLTFSLFLSERPLSDLPNPLPSIFLLQMNKAIFLSFLFLLRHGCDFDISGTSQEFPLAN